MSIHRPKRPTRKTESAPASRASAAAPAQKQVKWKDAVGTQPDEAFAPYSLKSKYAKHALLAHPKFGRGAVVGVEGSTVVVLFADGKKKLGHGMA